MLSCRDMAAKASDHIEKKLTLGQSLSYGVHLLRCGYCRQFLRHLRTTIKLSQRLPAPEPLSDAEAEKIVLHTLKQSEHN